MRRQGLFQNSGGGLYFTQFEECGGNPLHGMNPRAEAVIPSWWDLLGGLEGCLEEVQGPILVTHGAEGVGRVKEGSSAGIGVGESGGDLSGLFKKEIEPALDASQANVIGVSRGYHWQSQ